MARVLCTGDVHMGRIPSRIRQTGDEARAFSTSSAWKSIVQLAISEGVDALLIAGDLIDLENRLYEARGPIEDGVAALAGAGIPVVAVCGNHDAEFLPTICDRIPAGIQLIGQKQQWEEWFCPNAEEPKLAVHGWSFGARVVAENPLNTYNLNRAGTIPTIGLLHCDLDAAAGSYAPVRPGQFGMLANGPDCSVLGRVHKAKNHGAVGQVPVLYTGSACGLDPRRGRSARTLADRIRTRRISPPATNTDRTDLLHKPLSRCRRSRHGNRSRNPDPRCHPRLDSADRRRGRWGVVHIIVFRISVIGDVPPEWELDGHLRRIQSDTIELMGKEVVIDRLSNLTRLQLNLIELAAGNDPPGLIARRLMLLSEAGDAAERDRMVREARSALEKTQADYFRELGPLTDESIVFILQTEATSLLRGLLSSRMGGVSA